MNKILQLLKLLTSEKAVFAMSIFSAINMAVKAFQGGQDSMVELAYNYIPAKYKQKMTAQELKDAVAAYIIAFEATEKLFN